MLEQSIKTQVTDLFASLKNQYTFQIKVASSHPNREELVSLLTDVASCADKVNVDVQEESGLSFTLLKNRITVFYL